MIINNIDIDTDLTCCGLTKEEISNYKEYLGEEVIKLYNLSKTLVNLIQNTDFEWDISSTDSLLYEIRNTVNKIDI